MRPLLSRIPRKTKVTAVVLGAALLQVGVLAALGLESSRSRLQTGREELAARTDEVIRTRVVAAAAARLDALERTAVRELARAAGSPEERVQAALSALGEGLDAPAFVHGFVADGSGTAWHVRRPPLVPPPSVRDDDQRRRLDALEQLEPLDPRKALVVARSLADDAEAPPPAERDAVVAARALRVGWRCALVTGNGTEARRLANRVLDRYAALRDDRPGPEADSEPFGIGAGAVETRIVRGALARSNELRDDFVRVVVARRIRAQRLRPLLSPAGQALERQACADLLKGTELDLRPEDTRFVETELRACDTIDGALDLIERVPRERWARVLASDGPERVRIDALGGSRLVLAMAMPPHGDGATAPHRIAVFLSEPAALEHVALEAARQRAKDLPDGVALLVQDRAGGRVLGGDGPRELVGELRPLGDVAPGLVAGAYHIDPGALDRALRRERNIWLWTLAAAGLAVIAAALLAIRAVLRELRLARMKSDFVSNLSHELRTPLTSLRMFVDTLLEGRVRDDAERDECLQIIAQETDRLSRLVDRILQFAAYAKGRAPIDLQTADAGDAVRRAVELFRSRAAKLGTQLELQVEPELPETVIDRDAIVQVVLNLLDNAVKYAGHDGAHIRVSVRAAGARVRIEVEDDGPGVPDAERARIFEEFYRADDRLSGSVQGTGIGLALCRRIALAHGGRIEALSSRDLGGALFRLTLPDAEAARRRARATGDNE